MNHASSVGGDVESSSIISEREDVQARRDGDASRSNSSSSEKEQKESLRKKRRDSKLDYSSMYQSLMENSVTLHILMDDDFTLSKKRASKYLFGVDSTLAYTNKDYEKLVGDAALRKQVKLPKDKLGLCISLAMETNGTILAGTKLSAERRSARRFSSVAGARAARGAARCARTRCECRAGATHCRPCADTLRMWELAFFSTDDIDDLIDMAMEPPTIPSLS